MWQFAPNSIHYLLSLWQRMVASVPYVKANEPHMLETYAPEVTKAYVTSRLDSVAVIVRDGADDPLDDLGMVQQQLDQLSTIGRCEYEKTCALIVRLFDESAGAYQELVVSGNSNAASIAVQEGNVFARVHLRRKLAIMTHVLLFRSSHVVGVHHWRSDGRSRELCQH